MLDNVAALGLARRCGGTCRRLEMAWTHGRGGARCLARAVQCGRRVELNSGKGMGDGARAREAEMSAAKGNAGGLG
jgi:hypothetical protein